MNWSLSLLGCAAGPVLLGCVAASAREAPWINTWLVCGTFPNDSQNSGYERNWIGEGDAVPRQDGEGGGGTWRYFDDRLFSRNLDDYQDLFSYFKIKRGESIAARVAYAHVFVHSADARPCQLRVGADNEFKAWLNGQPVASCTESRPRRDGEIADVALQAGWNRLLLKIANQADGRFGFYARLCDADGGAVPGLTFSPNGPAGALDISTGSMSDAATGDLPVAFREWPYVAAAAEDVFAAEWDGRTNTRHFWKADMAMQASPFMLQASGGAPPYRWSLVSGDLPPGLGLGGDGRITGTVRSDADLRNYTIQVRVTDAEDARSDRALTLLVRERPNRWYEEARLTALIHGPERIPAGEHAKLAELMKRQGYGCGMPISFNNGRCTCRWPSVFEPDNEDAITPCKAALKAVGIRFGMYMGNLICPNNGGDNGGILLVEDAMRRFQPETLWFDWASTQHDGYASLDALYSMIRSISPDTLIILNGISTMYHGDWDVIVLEGWGAWGERHWNLWPFAVPWPKRTVVETWRLVADPEFEYSKGVSPDWREYLRLQIAVIAEGFVADIDHSPTIRQEITTLDESLVFQAHQRMADWANPPGLPPLHESYTQVNPARSAEGEWGYAVLSLSRKTMYLHIMTTPYGKTGFPGSGVLTLDPFPVRVRSAMWMNRGQALTASQEGTRLTVPLAGVDPDPIDTIIKLELAEPFPDVPPPARPRKPVPPGNLASYRPAQLLSADGSHPLVASGFSFARYGVDGSAITSAQGAYEWAWSFQVDLEDVYPVKRVVIHFGRGFATEYKLHLSPDGQSWRTKAHVTGASGGTREHAFEPVNARYIRVEAVKPDGPGQPGAQMAIAELEVYE